jgi:hypothetical protein
MNSFLEKKLFVLSIWKLTLGYSMLQQVLNYLVKLVSSGPC